MAGVRHDTPAPQLVRYNDWRRVELPAPGAFVPERPVSVIVSYYAQPEELGRTLAALEGQTYPRELFEVVVVDDGSPEPLERPRETPLDVKVVRQEDLGFGLARARNTGVRAAAHDILLFLDGDMLPEADWLAAHARWHHAVPDAVTLGFRVHVPVDGVDAGMIRSRPGTLKELFAGRKVDLTDFRWFESHLCRNDDLTSKVNESFLPIGGGSLGLRREFHELVGGVDESFTQWGWEDTEFGYRARTRGGLLVPVREAFAWHQGPWEEGWAEKERSGELQRAKAVHLIAHPELRGDVTGRTFTVPQYVVTMRGDGLSADRLLEAVERALSDPMRDLVVRLELPEDHAGRVWLERHLGPDPRVRVAPSRSALEEFPVSPFHVTLPAGKPLRTDVVSKLRAGLGTAVVGRSEFPDGSRVSIVRAWALHRALRTPWEASDFGDVVAIPPRKLCEASGAALGRALRSSWKRLRAELRLVDDPDAAWRFVRWFAAAVLRRVPGRFRAALSWKTPAMPAEAPVSARAEHPLGVEIVAPGARSRAVCEASGRVAGTTAGRRADVVVADPARVRHDTPPPQLVRYNDWRQVEVAAPGAFVPELPVSVVVPYYAQPEELGRTLAALEGQTYPRELFEVVVVDDGSPEPLERPRSTPLDVKVVRQEDLGFGAARARNTGVRAAAHDILLFLDADLLPEADWLAAHARWHHAVPDAVTVGLWLRVQVDGVDAETIRSRPGTLEELFKGRRVDPSFFESRLFKTGDLTSKADDPFQVVLSGNLGVRRGFHELVGGFDESFTQWGCEDLEFGYRACTRGGLLVPLRDAFAWHQGLWKDRAKKERSEELQRAKVAHLIAHPGYRTGTAGRSFTVPQHVVTVRGGASPADRLLEVVERALSDPMRDLVVRLELPRDHAGRVWLERHLGPDPRVRVAPSRSALEEFPVSPFHVTLPVGKPLRTDVVSRLRAELGTAVVGRSEFPDGSRASIVRAWALHRALRTPWDAADFGKEVTIPPRKLCEASGAALGRALRSSWKRLRAELRLVDGPDAAWRFVRWFAAAVLRRVLTSMLRHADRRSGRAGEPAGAPRPRGTSGPHRPAERGPSAQPPGNEGGSTRDKESGDVSMDRTGVPKVAAASSAATRDGTEAAAGGRAVDDAVGLSERRWSAEPRQHRMRVTIVTLFFPPEMGAAATRLFQLGKRLAAAGHQVQVLCPLPNYLRGEVFEDYRGRLRVVEQVAGMRVVRTWIYKTDTSRLPRPLRRWLKRVSFVASSLLLGAWSLGRQDVVLFNTPPLSIVPAGLVTGWLTRARTVMYVADLHPDIMLRLGFTLSRSRLRRERRWQRLGYERSDLVLTTTPSTMDEITRRFPHVSAAVLPNGADTDLFRPSLRRQSARAALGAGADDFLVGYFGLHEAEQGLEAVVDAAALADGSGMRFVMAGEGKAKAALAERARWLGIGNIRFLDVLPRSEVAAMLASCDAGLAPLACALPGTMPSKVWETLACGVPLVASDGSDAADLVRANGVGRVFKPGDGGDLARVLADLAARPRERERIRHNCLDLARRFDRAEVATRAETLFRDLLESR